MRIGRWLAIAFAALFVAGAAVGEAQVDGSAAAGSPVGLVRARSNHFDEVYLRPGADFRGYTKVMVVATQVTFAKRWLSNLNEQRIAVLQGTTAAEAGQIAEVMRSGLRDSFANLFESAGYEVVGAPGGHVLGVSLRLADLHINAPSTVTNALPSRVYTPNAGEATLILELRDTATGTLLARIIDRRITATRGTRLRQSVRTAGATTSATNQFDFESLFGLWAQNCIDDLKSQPQLATNVPMPKD